MQEKHETDGSDTPLDVEPTASSNDDPKSTAIKTKTTKKSSKKRKRSSKKKRLTAVPVPKRLPRMFPAVTLEEALRIPTAIKTKNGGNPWDPDQVAEAVNLSVDSKDFFYLAGAAVSYNLTIGGWKAPKIELADLGREVVYAPNADAENQKKLEAFLTIEVFARVLEHYKGSNLPEMKYLGNTLERDFGLPPNQHEEFSKIFRSNCEYLGIESGFTVNLQGGRRTAADSQQSIPLAGPTTITLAEPNKDSNLTAFVILPFVERDALHPGGFFQEVLRSLITPAARNAGFIVKTANRHGSDVIQSTIINDLLEADLVIADLTEHNPNVLFELGVRMSNDLPICLIKASGTGQIFDVDNLLRVYPYNSNLWASTIEKDLPDLTEHIKGAWDGRKNESSYMKILRRGVVAA